jgi:glucose dehydrogenase
MVLVLVALQIALFGLSAPTMLSFARHGDISPLTVLAAALSALALFAAGVFLATKKRAAIYLFAVAAALIGLVLMQWRAGIVIIGLIVSLIGCAIGSTLLKSQAKV